MATSATAPVRSGSRILRIQGMPLAKWLRTTPGRFRLASVVLVGALVLALIATASAANARRDAARAVALQAVPELSATVRLYGFLADADATASIIFLQAGLEDPALHQRYVDDLRHAGEQLAIVARQVGSSGAARRAVETISIGLPLYAGDVDSARANIRQGNQVGASYLRDASDRMRGERQFSEQGGILPAATVLYTGAAEMLDENYKAGTSGTEMVLVIAIGLVLIALLVGRTGVRDPTLEPCPQRRARHRNRRRVRARRLDGAHVRDRAERAATRAAQRVGHRAAALDGANPGAAGTGRRQPRAR